RLEVEGAREGRGRPGQPRGGRAARGAARREDGRRRDRSRPGVAGQAGRGARPRPGNGAGASRRAGGGVAVTELMTWIDEAAAALKKRTRLRPEVGIILGTGLGDFAGALEGESVVPYDEIPHFP